MPFSRPGVQLVAIIGGVESPAFKVLRVDKSVGANQLDHAVIRIDYGAPGVERFVQDLDLTDLRVDLPNINFALQGKEVEIVARTDDEEEDDVVIHWGKATVQEIECGDSESITLVSRLEDCHFGSPTQFQVVWDPATTNPDQADHYIVFNPEVDGGIVGNRNTNEDSKYNNHDVFVDPASIETRDGALVHGVEDWHDPDNPDDINEISERNWNLREAVLYLCNECNPDEEYITNPAEGDLPNILPEDRGLLKNLTIPPGLYLPEALDRLLNPYGFYWYIEYRPDVRKIRIFQAGVGVERELLWQEPGSVFNPDETNTSQVRLTYDASMAVNQVRAYGDFLTLEATWELKPAWLAEHDNLDPSDLSKGMPEWNEPDYQYHRVWRDWVLNEAGDYPRTWQDMDESSWATVDVYFRAAFEDKMDFTFAIVPKRRKFLPMLTRGPDGKPLGAVGGCVVEWFNPELPDADGGTGGNWEIIDPDDESFSCQLLPGECGIRFTGAYPPMVLMDMGSEARVRITATIRSDIRMLALSEREDTSVNPDVNEVVLDVGQEFHAKLIDEDSKYHETILSADTADGFDALQELADSARKTFDQAQCSGNAVLEGIDHFDYTISDLITKVKGREIKLALNTNGADAGLAYPQIVGISLDMQRQKTVITLNEFKDTTAWIASYLRKIKRQK